MKKFRLPKTWKRQRLKASATPEPLQPTKGLIDQSKEQAAAAQPAQSSGSASNQPAAPQAPATAGQTADAIAKKEEQQPVVTEASAPAPKPATPSDESKRPAEAEARRETSQVQVANEPPAEKTVEVAKVEDRKSADAEIAKARSD